MELSKCNAVDNSVMKYCPATGFNTKSETKNCLGALHKGDMLTVRTMCPVVPMDNTTVHITDIGPHTYSVYVPRRTIGRVMCSGKMMGTRVVEKGLKQIVMSPKCSYAAKSFELMAGVSMAVRVSQTCLLYTSPSPRDKRQSRMPSSA